MSKYALEFTIFDGLENSLSSARSLDRLEFSADSMQEARETASSVWRRMTKRRYRGWDGEMYPRAPRLILEVDWQP